MGAKVGRLGLLLVAAAVVVGLGAWLLTRDSGAAGPARDAAVLSRGRAAGGSAPPELPATGASRAAPEALAAAVPDAAAGGSAGGAGSGALPGEEALFTGRVVDESGAPIAGAIVSHVPTHTLRRPLGLVAGRSTVDLDWNRLPQAATGSDGRFSIPSRELARDPDAPPDPADRGYLKGVLGRGPPGLVVRHPGYEIRFHTCIGFRSGAYDAGDIVLPVGQVLTGRLVSRNGGVVGGADVGLPPNVETSMVARTGAAGVASRLLHVTSGPDGRFRLGSLGPGMAYLDVRHGDFVPLQRRLTVEAGTVLDLGDIELDPARHIRGIVRDADGRPLPDAWLLARGSAQRMGDLFGDADPLRQEIGSSIASGAGGQHEVRVGVDASGAFDLGTLDQTYYDVFADAPGHEPACLRDVQAGTDGLVLTLPAQATLLLTVLDAVGRTPLAGATARAWRHSDVESAFGDSLGSELEVLAGGAAAVAAGLPGDGAGLLLVQRAGDHGTLVVLSAPGRATTGFVLPGVRAREQLARTLELRREAVLEGLVQDTGGRPLAGASVTLSWPADDGIELPAHTTDADAEGRFRLDALVPGTWRLSAGARGFLERLPEPFEVVAGAAPQETVLTLARGAALAGLVLDADGEPAPDVTLEVTIPEGPWSGRKLQQETGGDGRFRYEVLPPGPVVIRAWPGGEARLTLATGETAEVTLALRHPPVVRGRVTRGGVPVAQVTVVGLESVDPAVRGSAPSFIHLGGGNERKDTTSATGEYTLEFVAPGTHLVQARAGEAWSIPASSATDWDRVEMVDLVFGSARLAGLVTDARSAQPVRGASVSVHARHADAALVQSPRVAEADPRDTTDMEGRFSFDELPPGAAEVRVSAEGYTGATREVALAADGTLSIDGAAAAELVVVLDPGIGLRGTVRMASGKPLFPDVVIGLETEALPALSNSIRITGARAAAVPWTWSGPIEPGPGTVKVWRSNATGFGKLAEEDVLASQALMFEAGETEVVDLVIHD